MKKILSGSFYLLLAVLIFLLIFSPALFGNNHFLATHLVGNNYPQQLQSLNDENEIKKNSTLNILTQNTMLIPFSFVAPDFKKRAEYIAGLLPGSGFDIIGLQEVFWDNAQNMILGAWYDTDYLSDQVDSKNLNTDWKGIKEARDVTRLSNTENQWGIKIYNARPQGNNKTAKIIFGPYFVLGPDTFCWNFLKQDSGLLILSRYPILAASAFSFSAASGSDKLANKGVLYAKIKVGPGPDDYIHFFTTHLQSHDYPQTRLDNLRELLEFVNNIVLMEHEDKVIENSPVTTQTATNLKKANPIIITGDLNVKADMPSGWLKKASVLSSPAGTTLPDDADPTLNRTPGYTEFLNVFDYSSEFKLTDAWYSFYPEEPGFTWMGKDWQTAGSNPYGADGNNYAIESGPPERIDYIFYYEGSEGLKLNPVSIKLFPQNSESAQVSDHLGLQFFISLDQIGG